MRARGKRRERHDERSAAVKEEGVERTSEEEAEMETKEREDGLEGRLFMDESSTFIIMTIDVSREAESDG